MANIRPDLAETKYWAEIGRRNPMDMKNGLGWTIWTRTWTSITDADGEEEDTDEDRDKDKDVQIDVHKNIGMGETCKLTCLRQGYGYFA